jgi:Spy/CpxP family protein refolding chaperone
MLKRVPKFGQITLLTKDDRAFIAEFRKSSQSHVDKVTQTKESAMKELVDAGIYDRRGKLRKQYRSVA